MPWTSRNALAHTKKANNNALKALWSRTANGVLRSSGDDAKAIRIANYIVARRR